MFGGSSPFKELLDAL